MQGGSQNETNDSPKIRRNLVSALPLSLVRARESVMSHFRNLLRRYNLTEPQWRVLRTINVLHDIEMTELSRITALLMPSLSRIVRELEVRGYLSKEADPTDLRRTLVRLTEAGRSLVAMASPECEAVYCAIRDVMGNEKVRQLNALLAELETKLATLDIAFDAGEHPSNVLALAPGKQRGRPRKSA